METALSFILGVITSIIGSYIYNYYHSMNERISNVAIEGNWAEFVAASKNHRYSLGRVYYDGRRRLYAFDGTNYADSGQPYCYWETVASCLDITQRKYYYIFTAQLKGALGSLHYGFGVLNLSAGEGGRLRPVDGYYVSAEIDEQPMSHSMITADKMTYARDGKGAEIIGFIESSRRV